MPWLAANLVLGLVVTAALVWVSKRYADRWARSPFSQRLMDDIAGRNLKAASGFLGELSRFEKEEGAA